MVGSVAGDGDANPEHDGNHGMAPAARLVIQDGGIKIDDCADLTGLGCPVRPLEPGLLQAYAQWAPRRTPAEPAAAVGRHEGRQYPGPRRAAL